MSWKGQSQGKQHPRRLGMGDTEFDRQQQERSCGQLAQHIYQSQTALRSKSVDAESNRLQGNQAEGPIEESTGGQERKHSQAWV